MKREGVDDKDEEEDDDKDEDEDKEGGSSQR